jgi:hypothetical protein
VPCKKKLRGCGHCGWLATRLIRAARPADQKGALIFGDL